MGGSGGGSPVLPDTAVLYNEIGKGNVTNVYTYLRGGENPSIGTSLESMWALGGQRVLPTSSGVMSVKSSSANDTSAGTGARTVLVSGLDSSYEQVTDTVTLNGTTEVDTTVSFLRVNLANVVTAGSGNSNAGNITVETKADNSAQAYIPIGFNRSHMADYTVPTGYNLMITDYVMSSASGQGIEIEALLNHPTLTGGLPVVVFDLPCAGTTTYVNMRVPFLVPATADMCIMAKKISGSSDFGSMLLQGFLLPAEQCGIAGNTAGFGGI